jgi:hypothetical protein
MSDCLSVYHYPSLFPDLFPSLNTRTDFQSSEWIPVEFPEHLRRLWKLEQISEILCFQASGRFCLGASELINLTGLERCFVIIWLGSFKENDWCCIIFLNHLSHNSFSFQEHNAKSDWRTVNREIKDTGSYQQIAMILMSLVLEDTIILKITSQEIK